jgi:hypothetical protein
MEGGRFLSRGGLAKASAPNKSAPLIAQDRRGLAKALAKGWRGRVMGMSDPLRG